MTPPPSPPHLSVEDIRQEASSLDKAVKEDQPSKNVIAILERLEAGVQATADLLRSTKIGIQVNRLKSNQDPAIAATAARITQKWKEVVGRTKHGDIRSRAVSSKAATPKSSQPATTNGERSRSGTPKITTTTVKTPVNSQKNGLPTPDSSTDAPKPTGPVQRRTDVTDKISFAGRTDSSIRDQHVKLMYNGLANTSQAESIAIVACAVEIEKAAYNFHSRTPSEPYRKQLRSLFQILGNRSNPQLRHQLIDGSITAHEFINRPAEAFLSTERQEEMEKMRKENMDNAMIPKEVKAVSTLLTCPKCQKRDVTYSQAQTRSADEPMTNFCECQSCGNRWKFC